MEDNFFEKIYNCIKSIENIVVDLFKVFIYVFVILRDIIILEIKDIKNVIWDFIKKIIEKQTVATVEYYKNNPHKWKKKRKKRAIRKLRIAKAKVKIKNVGENISTDMAKAIVKIDDKNDKIANKSVEKLSRGQKRINFFRRWAHQNLKTLLTGLTIIFFLAISSVLIYDMVTAYEYSYNGRTLGLVKRQEEVLKLMDLISEKLSKEYKAEIKIDKEQDIEFKRVISIKKRIDTTEDVLKRLTYMKNMSAKAYAIYIDGEQIAILDTKKACEDVIDQARDEFISNSLNVKYESVDLKEDIKIRKIDTKLGKIENRQDVLNELLTGGVDRQVHIVERGDTLSVIAKNYGISLQDLIEANPEMNIRTLRIGQEVVLTKPAPLLTLQTVEIATYQEPIPYETEYQDSSRIYKGENRVKVSGKEGVRDVTARITRENGVQVHAKILVANTIEQPRTQVVIRGTKPLPPLKGTGILKMPMSRYKLTSRYGSRWGGFHRGIDLAAPTGTRIGASDGGTVISSGYRRYYGYCVEIDHGGGITTLYAHCNKLYVQRGDRVYQNQHIADVGNTGNSTGSHCHFEVRLHGAHKNPFNYLK